MDTKFSMDSQSVVKQIRTIRKKYHGTLEMAVIAESIGMPVKTLYRALERKKQGGTLDTHHRLSVWLKQNHRKYPV